MSTLSIRLRPSVQALLEQRCKQQRVNKSQLVNDLIEQTLGAEQSGHRAAALLDELLDGIEGSRYSILARRSTNTIAPSCLAQACCSPPGRA
jgi:hypothetical protein